MSNLGEPIKIRCVSSDYWRKEEHPESGNPTGMGKHANSSLEGLDPLEIQPSTILLSGTMPPPQFSHTFSLILLPLFLSISLFFLLKGRWNSFQYNYFPMNQKGSRDASLLLSIVAHFRWHGGSNGSNGSLSWAGRALIISYEMIKKMWYKEWICKPSG